MLASRNLVTTGAFSSATLLLGIPIAVATSKYAHVHVPAIVLGTKEIDLGPSGTKTLTFGPLTAPTDAVLSAAYISIITSVLCTIGVVLVRIFHNTKKGIAYSWITICIATTNFLSQVACLAAWGILQGKENAKVPAEGAIQYSDGRYRTNGQLFTVEAWACTMERYFSSREDWAHKACADLQIARGLTAGIALCAAIMMGLVYWQIHEQGGVSWLSVRRRRLRQLASYEDGHSFKQGGDV